MIEDNKKFEDMGLETYLTIKDIQEHLGIGRTKAYELVNSSDFPKIKILGSIRIPKKDYIKWLEAQRKRGMFF